MLIAAAGAAGVVIALAAVVGVGLWYVARPKPPKPWNTGALKASFDFVDTEGEGNNLVFFYTVENTTPFDYRVSGSPELSIAAKLKQQKSLTFDRDRKGLSLDYPVLVPAGQRVRLSVHLLEYSYSPENVIDNAIRGTPKGTQDKWLKYRIPPAHGPDPDDTAHREAVKKYVSEVLENLDGFVLFDEAHRYEIELPRGW